ncbi:MAG: dihydrofolate reductase family protein [Longimicrobiales bacterium]
MRRVRYGVGMSLDGYIADSADDMNWMIGDPGYDSKPFFASIDTVLMGRRSYEVMLRHGARTYRGLHTYVFSRTLRTEDYPEVTILADDGLATVTALRQDTGKDIWLTGGGQLFRSLLEADLVDTVELGISPVLLGQGLPLLPPCVRSVRLALTHHQAFPSGLLVLHYAVQRPAS